MTTRELFDTVRDHLLQQARRSWTKDGFCAYRGEHGLKCAVGCLIKDEFYRPSHERKAADTLPVRHAVELSIGRLLTSKELDMLRDLQIVHDSEGPADWQSAIAEIELDYLPKLESQ